MENIKEKIKKLLALSTSPNENEARAALLKAKELMAKNKLTEEDFEDREIKLVSLNSDVKWTTDSGNIWMARLCSLIADNYLCSASWGTPRGSRTHKLVITGLDEDAELCKVVIEYAVDFVLSAIKRQQRRNAFGNEKAIANSYAEGFILGLEMAFEEQQEDHPEWGLVVVKPQEVQDYEKGLGTRSVRTRETEFDPLSYARGQNDGMNFNARKVLAG